MALSVDANDRLWAVWTGGRARCTRRDRAATERTSARRSRSRSPAPRTRCRPSASRAPVDVVVNTGSTLVEQQLLPGLSVQRLRRSASQWWAQALDDGFRVPRSTTFTIGGRTFHGNGAGKAKVVRRLREGCGSRLRGRRVQSSLAPLP